jgi:hypothetical protein
VELGNDLNWNHHIDQTTTKAIGILAFLRRNLNKCSKEVKEKAYTTLIRPNLEYGSSVWDFFHQYQIDAVEMVQRRASRFVTGQYNRYQSVTSMLQELKWTSLQQRRQEQRLVNLIFASQGLRFVSPFSPPLADLEYNLKFARNATWWFIEVAPLR